MTGPLLVLGLIAFVLVMHVLIERAAARRLVERRRAYEARPTFLGGRR